MGSVPPNKCLYRTVGHLGNLWHLLRRDAEHCEAISRAIGQHLEGTIELHRFSGHQRLRGNHTKIAIVQLKRKVELGRSCKVDKPGQKSRVIETDVLGMASLPLICYRMHRMQIINNSMPPHSKQYKIYHTLHISLIPRSFFHSSRRFSLFPFPCIPAGIRYITPSSYHLQIYFLLILWSCASSTAHYDEYYPLPMMLLFGHIDTTSLFWICSALNKAKMTSFPRSPSSRQKT